MGALDGRVALITGAGRGIGREHALLYAREGAKVVVNDLGGSTDGSGSDLSAAEEVVAEIKAMGGEAIANGDSVTDWEGGARMVKAAVDAFGDLHVLVNNAGILRDRMLVNMNEAEWDSVVEVHMKGHFVPLRHAAGYWREQTKAGKQVKASVINTSSTSGVLGNVGQTNYGAAKAGIAALSLIAALELGRYGIRVNCLCPNARTRLTLQTPGLDKLMAKPEDPTAFDQFAPENVSPLVAALGMESCTATGETYIQLGNRIIRTRPWTPAESVDKKGQWDVAELSEALATLPKTEAAKLFG